MSIFRGLLSKMTSSYCDMSLCRCTVEIDQWRFNPLNQLFTEIQTRACLMKNMKRSISNFPCGILDQNSQSNTE